MKSQRALVRGAGDIASAVACRLFQAGYRVILHEASNPTATRRGMAFTDAVFDGEAVLENVRACRVDSLESLLDHRLLEKSVLLTTAEFDDVLSVSQPDVLIDARMRKRAQPDDIRRLAPLTIGLGPNFIAGGNVDIAVETSWEDLGRVIYEGPTLEFRGEPRPIGGRARERYVYAPVQGTFRTGLKIGDRVEAGQVVAWIDDVELQAPLSGFLRGLTHDNVPVAEGTKVIEVDPRQLDDVTIWGIAERPEKIARAVLLAVTEWSLTGKAPILESTHRNA